MYLDDLYITDIPAKGKGIIALRYFQRGETVLAEVPLFTQNIVRGNTSVLAALAQCSVEQQVAFFRLHNCHGRRYAQALGIFETNVLPCGSNDAHGHVAQRGGIFLTGARFNHSCVPNVNNHWDAARGQLVFRALRDIEAGEELCLSYGRLLAKRSERRAELRAKFGFECACEACSLEGKALAASEARRECLAMLYSAHLRGSYGDPRPVSRRSWPCDFCAKSGCQCTSPRSVSAASTAAPLSPTSPARRNGRAELSRLPERLSVTTMQVTGSPSLRTPVHMQSQGVRANGHWRARTRRCGVLLATRSCFPESISALSYSWRASYRACRAGDRYGKGVSIGELETWYVSREGVKY